MKIGKYLSQGLLITVALTLVPVNASSAQKVSAGSACKVLNQKVVYDNKTFTCIKSGKLLLWNKGVAVKPLTTQITVSNISEYRSSEDCKLKTNMSGTNETNQSHQERAFLKPDISKTIRALIFPVDFPDIVSADQNAPSVLKSMTEDFAAFYKSQSNGKIKFEWTIAPKFSRLDKTAASFGVGRSSSLSNSSNYWGLNYAFQDLALKTYKHGDFDIFIAVTPSNTSEDLIATSPAFFTKDTKYWPGNWIGGDYWRDDRKWFYPTHEFGHYVLGLDDLRPPSVQAGQNSSAVPMGHYDIMGTQAAPEFTAWNRWIAGLIEDRQILCLATATTTTKLKAIEEVNSEVKGLVIPVSNSKVIVIENRAAIGYDSKMPLTSVGVIAYSVDVSVPRSQSPMKLIREPSAPVDAWNKERGGLITPRVDGLKLGESFTYSGITIKVVGQDKNDMFVQVSFKS